MDLVTVDDRGIACALGGFVVDPWSSTDVAVLTHAHADHARPGMGEYHCAKEGARIARKRLGEDARIVAHPYGEPFRLGEALVSLHPAGHVRGSAQVRIEAADEVWVVSGDFKRRADPTARAFEVVPCDAFVTEATFALPIYRWPDPEAELDRLLEVWRRGADAGRATVLFAYALGKAQRILAMLAGRGALPGPILTHGAVESMNDVYRQSGVALPETRAAVDLKRGADLAGALVVAPPSAAGSPFMKRFGDAERCFASGWMRLRGPRRRRAIGTGLVISDHADWPALLETIEETGAKRVFVTHGYSEQLARYLADKGFDAATLETSFVGEPTEAE